jgi:hypothetical protein
MKIIISEKEFYQLEIREEMPFEDFRTLVKKLTLVVSFVDGKDISAKQISSSKTTTPRPRPDVIELLKAYFTLAPDSPEMNKILERYGLKYNTLQQRKPFWVRNYKITAEELGLKELPKNKANAEAI